MSKNSATHNIEESYMPLLPGDDLAYSQILENIVNHVVLAAIKIKFKPTIFP